eukprot:10956296-Prorocentrum_lima.AAC.1
MPGEVGSFILERYVPFPVPTTLAPYGTLDESQRHARDDVGYMFIFCFPTARWYLRSRSDATAS